MRRHPKPSAEPASNHRRPHLFDLTYGLIDAHVNQVDFFDTVGGREIVRLVQQRRHPRRDAAAPPSIPAQRDGT